MNDTTQDTTQYLTGKCEQCGEAITPAATAKQLNINRALHMRKRHGVVGAWHRAPKSAGSQFTGKCEQCGEPITPANNQVQFNRNRGLHMKMTHGIPGRGHATTTKFARQAAAAESVGQGTWAGKPLLMTPEAIAKRIYQKKWRDDHVKAARATVAPVGRGKWVRGRPLKMTAEAIRRREYQKTWRENHTDKRKTLSAARRAQLDAARQARWGNRNGQEAQAAANGTMAAPAPVGQPAAAEPCNLSECPVCHSRFYVVRGT